MTATDDDGTGASFEGGRRSLPEQDAVSAEAGFGAGVRGQLFELLAAELYRSGGEFRPIDMLRAVLDNPSNRQQFCEAVVQDFVALMMAGGAGGASPGRAVTTFVMTIVAGLSEAREAGAATAHEGSLEPREGGSGGDFATEFRDTLHYIDLVETVVAQAIAASPQVRMAQRFDEMISAMPDADVKRARLAEIGDDPEFAEEMREVIQKAIIEYERRQSGAAKRTGGE